MPEKSVLDVTSKSVKPLRDATVVPLVSRPSLPRTNTQHPCMATKTSTMHDDGFASDASVFGGPHGKKASIRYFKNTTTRFGGICASFGIDDAGNLFTISFTRTKTTLLRLDPKTLDPKNAFALPPRDVKIFDAMFKVDKVFKSTAGAYFYVDNHGRVVVPTLDRDIWVVGTDGEAPREAYFACLFRIATDVPAEDAINATVPVWDATPHSERSAAPSGYWFLTEAGRVGVARPDDRPQVATISLPNGERVGNSFACGPKGLFVVSALALYRIALVDDVITILWRTTYDQGEAKRGQLAPGSGTTPTLLGDRYVSIGDNAEVMKVCLFDQDTGALLDARPVFADQVGSACENSFIGYERSLVVSNTYGYLNPMRMRGYEQAFGITRLDVDPVTGKLAPRWYRDDVAAMSGIPKLALGNGLIYVYTMKWLKKPKLGAKAHQDLPGRWRWTLLGLDFSTGKTMYAQDIFEGEPVLDHDNGWGTLAPGPDQTLYIGMWRGAMRVSTAG